MDILNGNPNPHWTQIANFHNCCSPLKPGDSLQNLDSSFPCSWKCVDSSKNIDSSVTGSFEGSVQCKISVDFTEPPFPNPTTVLVDIIIILVCLINCGIFWRIGAVQNLCGFHRTPISKSNSCPGWPHQHWLAVCLKILWFFEGSVQWKISVDSTEPHFQIWQLSWFTTSTLVGVLWKLLDFFGAWFTGMTPQNPHFQIWQLSWFTTSSLVGGVPQKLMDLAEATWQATATATATAVV